MIFPLAPVKIQVNAVKGQKLRLHVFIQCLEFGVCEHIEKIGVIELMKRDKISCPKRHIYIGFYIIQDELENSL